MQSALKTILFGGLGSGLGGLAGGALFMFAFDYDRTRLFPLLGLIIGFCCGFFINLNNKHRWLAAFYASLGGLISGVMLVLSVDKLIALPVGGLLMGVGFIIAKKPRNIRAMLKMGVSGSIIGISGYVTTTFLYIVLSMKFPIDNLVLNGTIFLTIFSCLIGSMLGLSLWLTEKKAINTIENKA